MDARGQDRALQFRIDEGQNINSFLRDESVAAHLVLRAGTEPRIVVAFPAGNSGVGVWFEHRDEPVAWTLLAPPRPTSVRDTQGRQLRGIVTEIEADAETLRIREVLLTSVRILREYQALGSATQSVYVESTRVPNGLTWARDRLDGAAGYRLSIEVQDGGRIEEETLGAAGAGPLRLKLTAVTGEAPLTPIPERELLTAQSSGDVRGSDVSASDGRASDGRTSEIRTRQVLTFLSYREKYLAGSWRFNTYFGRDTLMSLALLKPALQPRALEYGLASVLERLSPAGEVAHEEEVGEFAVLRNLEAQGKPRDEARYDYGMIDGSFLLPTIIAEWLLDDPRGRDLARRFLSTPSASGEPYGHAMVRNFEWVLEQASTFARDPRPRNLVSIKSGRNTGQWRDSEEGLGGGRYPYDVNVALVPAALESIQRLYDSGLLSRYLSFPERRRFSEARAHLRIWTQYAPGFFEVQVPAGEASAQSSRYAIRMGMERTAGPSALSRSEALRFDALSLDEDGRPVPVMHSDVGFTLLFGVPTRAQLHRAIDSIMRPFPEGLWTPIGVLVANPAFAEDSLQALFGRSAYHGTVVWSWQHAVLAAGLDRQLARRDLPDELRQKLLRARARLWMAIDATASLRSSELWSWSFSGGCYRIEPFGANTADVDESNAAQLWSTVFLAIPRPSIRSFAVDDSIADLRCGDASGQSRLPR